MSVSLRRSALALAATATALAGAFTAPASAQPRVEAPIAARANAPTVSPAVSTFHTSSGSITCDSGYLCAAVPDPTTGDYKVFLFYKCSTYSLSYWHGTGVYADSQTGSPTTYFYGSSGNVLKQFKPPAQGSYNWDPVYKIKPC